MLERFFRFSPRRFIDEKVLDEHIRCQTRNQGFWDDFRIIPRGFSSRISDQPFIAMHPRRFFDFTRYFPKRLIWFLDAGWLILSYYWYESNSSCFRNSFATYSEKDETILISYQLNFSLISNSSNWHFSFTVCWNSVVDAQHRCLMKGPQSKICAASLEKVLTRTVQRHETGVLILAHLSHQAIHSLSFLSFSDVNLMIQSQYKSGTLFD